MRLGDKGNMTKIKLDSLPTKNYGYRDSVYGPYYLAVDKHDAKSQSHIFPRCIFVTTFETENGLYRYTEVLVRHSFPDKKMPSDFYIKLLIPVYTTIEILKHKSFVLLLLMDKQITELLYEVLMPTTTYIDPYYIPHTQIKSFGTLNGVKIHIRTQTEPTLTKEFLEAYFIDPEVRLKLAMNLPIDFEDIEETKNLEVREKVLKKFGYENYVKEGIKRKKVEVIKFRDGAMLCPQIAGEFNYINSKYDLWDEDEEKIIHFKDGIAFLQVKDSSTGKTYFLKIPPNMNNVREAKAWTFGLDEKEYNLKRET